MSKWKQQIDYELGLEHKFSKALEQKIMQKASKKPSKNFAYPLTLVGACFIALLLFFTWPGNTNSPEQKQVHSNALALNNLAKTDSVIEFYVSYLVTDEDELLARSNMLALGVTKFSSKDDIEVIMPLLWDARLTTKSLTSTSYDIVLRFESGLEKKVKIFDRHDSIEILDLDTNLTYEVGGDRADGFLDLIEIQMPSIIPFQLLTVISIFLICIKFKDRAPFSIKISITFIVLSFVILVLSSLSIILTIWIPVAILIWQALNRLRKLKQQDYDQEKFRKIKLYTILLIMMWLVVFMSQLLGGLFWKS